MTIRFLMAALLAFTVAQPAVAQLKSYSIYGDSSTDFPTGGVTLRPYTLRGLAEIDDSGASPILKTLDLVLEIVDVVPGDTTCCTDTTVSLDIRGVIDINGLPATGTGTTATNINWGAIPGWAFTEFPDTFLSCIVFPGPTCPGCTDSCTSFVGFVGTGLLPNLKSTVFNPGGPWDFTVSGGNPGIPGGGAPPSSFTASSFEVINLVGGAIKADIQPRGFQIQIPTLPLLGLGVLGAGFLGVGARLIRNRRQ